MCGRPGQIHLVQRQGTGCSMAWQSMRIKRRFTLPELVVTIPGGTYDNLRRWARRLLRHGYIEPIGPSGSGHPGRFQGFRLVRGADLIEPPLVCDRCGRPLREQACRTPEREGNHDEG